MHGDHDPEIDGFLSVFLGDGRSGAPQRAQPAGRRARQYNPLSSVGALIEDGLAIDPEDLARLGVAPKARPRAQRNEKFCQLLEDMANDFEANGPNTEVMPSREVTPRSSVASPPPKPAELDWSPDPWDSPDKEEDDDLDEADPAEDEAEDGSSDGDASDAEVVSSGARDKVAFHTVEATRLDGLRTTSTSSFFPTEPSNQISVSVSLNTGRSILDRSKIDLDASLEELFARVEKKLGKDIQTLFTSHGLQLERADLPIKWSGLKDGDTITAVQNARPAVQERKVAASEHGSPSKPSTLRTFGIDRRDVPSEPPVSMGAFGDEIAAVAKSALEDSAVTSTPAPRKKTTFAGFDLPKKKTFAGFDLPSHLKGPSSKAASADLPSPPSSRAFKADLSSPDLPSHWSFSGGGNGDGAADEGDGLADHWLAASVLGRTDEISAKTTPGGEAVDDDDEVVSIPRSKLGMPSVPIPPDIMPDEFEDLPSDMWKTPPSLAEGPFGHSQARVAALEGHSPLKTELASLSKPRANRNLASPSPPDVAPSPLSSRVDLALAPTPSRRTTLNPLRQQRPDAQELKQRQEAMQKQSDSFWANVADTLGPAGAATTTSGSMGRKSLSVPALMGTTGIGGKKLGKRRG